MQIPHVDPEKNPIAYNSTGNIFVDADGNQVHEGFILTHLEQGALVIVPIVAACGLWAPLRYSEDLEEAYTLLKRLHLDKNVYSPPDTSPNYAGPGNGLS